MPKPPNNFIMIKYWNQFKNLSNRWDLIGMNEKSVKFSLVGRVQSLGKKNDNVN